jgi:hypothetical protein
MEMSSLTYIPGFSVKFFFQAIFSNSSHLEWRAELSDIIVKGTHPRTIPARFGLIRFRGFRGEDVNVKVYDVRRTDDDGRQVMAKDHIKEIENLDMRIYNLLIN